MTGALDHLIALEKSAMVPSTVARELTWRALEASVSSGAPAPVEIPVPPSGTSLVPISLLATALFVVGGSVAYWSSDGPPPPRAIASVDASVIEAPPIVAPPPPLPPPVQPKKAKRVVRSEPPPRSSLAEQIAFLREGQRALGSGDFADALAKARDHRRRFPSSPLEQERSALEVLAACSARHAEGRDLMKRFLDEWPRSPQADRVRVVCSVD